MKTSGAGVPLGVGVLIEISDPVSGEEPSSSSRIICTPAGLADRPCVGVASVDSELAIDEAVVDAVIGGGEIEAAFSGTCLLSLDLLASVIGTILALLFRLRVLRPCDSSRRLLFFSDFKLSADRVLSFSATDLLVLIGVVLLFVGASVAVKGGLGGT